MQVLYIASTDCFYCCYRRVPEIVFKGSDVWIQMDNEELVDVKDVLTWFLISSIIERLFHAVLEVPTMHIVLVCADTSAEISWGANKKRGGRVKVTPPSLSPPSRFKFLMLVSFPAMQ